MGLEIIYKKSVVVWNLKIQRRRQKLFFFKMLCLRVGTRNDITQAVGGMENSHPIYYSAGILRKYS